MKPIRSILLAAALLTLPVLSPASADTSKLDQAVKTFAAVINGHDANAVDRLFDQSYRQHTPMARNQPAKAFKGFAMAMFKAFPDVKATYTPMVAQGDRITFTGVVSGTHKGSFFGMPATGKRIRWTEMHIFKVRAGRVVEHWVQADMFGIVQQIRAAAKKK